MMKFHFRINILSMKTFLNRSINNKFKLNKYFYSTSTIINKVIRHSKLNEKELQLANSIILSENCIKVIKY
jgi:hypothetical protein